MTDWQIGLLKYLTEQALDVQLRHRRGDKVADDIMKLGAYSYGLYTDLTRTGHKIAFSEDLRHNRGVEPTEPTFFFHLHSIIDFVQAANRGIAGQM